MFPFLLASGVYFAICLVKAKREKAAAVKAFEELPEVHE